MEEHRVKKWILRRDIPYLSGCKVLRYEVFTINNIIFFTIEKEPIYNNVIGYPSRTHNRPYGWNSRSLAYAKHIDNFDIFDEDGNAWVEKI